ncbi:terminase large subunit [uncultured Mediterranean phage uvDeep-CGR2-AD10-C281]|nr:terminase large subunit [uncultured Mediterranean phage uvDeep-CGR2-AD10-C281]
MPEVVIPYKPRKLQKFLHNQILKHRFNVIIAHRRSGKTVLCINHLIRAALINTQPNPRYAFIAPTFKQGKSTAWDYIKNYCRNIPYIKFNESELRCDFPNGSRITILGAENDQALRGIFLDGCVFDETQNISPVLFPEIIRPSLADRKGWCIFIGTPKGQNYFYKLHKQALEEEDWWTGTYKASQTKVLDDKELSAAQRVMSKDLYEQEFECSFQAAITGSYYGKIIEELEKSNRITDVPYDENLKTETWWDLGLKDSTAIWFVQRLQSQLRIIDYYENSGEGLDFYADVLDSKPYKYDRHIAPHDIKVRELGAYGKSRLETALELGISFDIAPKLSIEDGIEMVRKTLPQCYFDQNKTYQGIEALKAYQKKWDERNQCFKNRPTHNFASHPSDAFRTGCTFFGGKVSDWKKKIKVDTSYVV